MVCVYHGTVLSSLVYAKIVINMLPLILLFTFFSMILSLILVSGFLWSKKFMNRITFYLVSFAAGALLATGFSDTLPEAVEMNEHAFIYTTIGIAIFFIIERIFLNFHHHEEKSKKEHIRVPVSFLIFGDILHNFIDGISIAATFIVSVPLGILTSIAVFAHEIPHELGDFGLLLQMGYSRKKVFLFNFLTGLVAFAGALFGYFLTNSIGSVVSVLLAITSANFIYLSLSDLIPEIHHRSTNKTGLYHIISFLLGIGLVLILGMILHV